MRYAPDASVVAAMHNVSVSVWDMALPALNATANQTLPLFLAGVLPVPLQSHLLLKYYHAV